MPAEPLGFALADYKGTMSPETRLMLKRVKFLPPAAQWNSMSEDDQYDLVEGAKLRRADIDRRFNERNNPQAGQPANQVQPQPVQRPAGSSGQSPVGQTAAANLPPDVAQHLADVASEFGEDSSIYRSQLAMTQRYEEQLQRLQPLAEQFQTERKQTAQDKIDRQFEDVAAEQLKDKFPQLTDPAKRDQARETGRQYVQMLAQQGRINTSDPAVMADLPRRAMEWGAAFHFSQENQQNSQQSREAARTRSLSNTFAPNKPTQPVNNTPADQDEAMKKIWAGTAVAHSEGKSGKEAVRQALRAVS